MRVTSAAFIVPEWGESPRVITQTTPNSPDQEGLLGNLAFQGKDYIS